MDEEVEGEYLAAIVKALSGSFADDGGAQGYQGSSPIAFDSIKFVVDCE